jgi:kumamolisin
MVHHVPLPGSARTLAPNSRRAGSIDPNEIAALTLRVRPGDAGAFLSGFVAEQAELPIEKRTYLTHEELEARHGARPEDLDLIETYANAHSLVVTYRSARERIVVVRGRLADLLAAFPANVHIYHSARGPYRGRQGEVRVPDLLAGIVTAVSGYDTRPKHRSRSRKVAPLAGGPGGVNGVSPADFATRYAFPTKHGGKTLDGAGQTVAIIELGGGYRTSDLKVYFSEIGVPTPKVTAISVDHAGNAPSTADTADGEVMLDIEVVGAVVPKARIAVYFGPNVGNRGFLDAISAAVHDAQRKPSVISISWGAPEEGLDAVDQKAYSDLFTEAAALGITICAASGDHGVADLSAGDWDGKIHVDHPCADPMVLACGGTQIEGGVDVVWNDGVPFDSQADKGGWAGGGGVSTRFALPAYQAGAGVPVSIASGNPGRGVPDIAMSATNYFVRVDSFEGASGGTSAVAPLMAALVARLNQAKGKRMGFLHPFLYANAATVMRDVTSGDNGIVGTVAGYPARVGWDACTGLGTPIGNQILAKV